MWFSYFQKAYRIQRATWKPCHPSVWTVLIMSWLNLPMALHPLVRFKNLTSWNTRWLRHVRRIAAVLVIDVSIHESTRWFLGMTKLPILPIRKLPEVSSNRQVSRCFMALGGIWKAFQVVFWWEYVYWDVFSDTWWNVWYLTNNIWINNSQTSSTSSGDSHALESPCIRLWAPRIGSSFTKYLECAKWNNSNLGLEEWFAWHFVPS